MKFKKYQHIERFGTRNVLGIDAGTCHIFHKLDGTNGSIWNEDGVIKCGSRNRELSLENDNAGFCAYVQNNPSIKFFLMKHPFIRLYGEWLVPHTLKTYNEKAWREFYVFDITENGSHVHYDIYKSHLDIVGINYIPSICTIKNPQIEDLNKCLEQNQFLVKDGEGNGEGIVIKNYEYANCDGDQIWAKIVSNEFKGFHGQRMGSPSHSNRIIEDEIVNHFCTKSLIDKEYAKIAIDGWESRMIPQLLGRVYYELVNEESWNMIKKFKNPTIDFKKLQQFVNHKIKQEKGELF